MPEDESSSSEDKFKNLFRLYASSSTHKPQKPHRSVTGNKVSLRQIDSWLREAGLLDGEVFSLTDTGLCYMKYRKWRLCQDEFLEFLESLCLQKNIRLDRILAALVAAKPPSGKHTAKTKNGT